ncbi:MAG: 6-carboxytetrahydropterin synthase [Phycisphaerae bacterium]|nr:6-carboxytetrahydropterin synthase [Phycisphaerae bacterium]
MVELTRTVRFSVNPPGVAPAASDAGHPTNGYAAYPTMRGLGRHYELDLTVRGTVSPQTGYILGIQDLDALARRVALPVIDQACAHRPGTEPGHILREIFPRLASRVRETLSERGELARLRWRLSPYYQVEMSARSNDAVLLRQRFEFAASHRLHTPSLSDDRNREIFGKCNRPSGHGHNYVVEPCVRVSLDGAAFALADLERATHRAIIEPFDHTHLNIDRPEFLTGTGQNPSVENIARVCFERLRDELAGSPATLRCITVWETEKTSCTYPADA